MPAGRTPRTELDERVARVREMWSCQFGDAALLAHDILRTLDGQEPVEGGDGRNPDDDGGAGPDEPCASTVLEKVAGRTPATVCVLCLVALMIGGTLALLRWWLQAHLPGPVVVARGRSGPRPGAAARMRA